MCLLSYQTCLLYSRDVFTFLPDVFTFLGIAKLKPSVEDGTKPVVDKFKPIVEDTKFKPSVEDGTKPRVVDKFKPSVQADVTKIIWYLPEQDITKTWLFGPWRDN